MKWRFHSSHSCHPAQVSISHDVPSRPPAFKTSAFAPPLNCSISAFTCTLQDPEDIARPSQLLAVTRHDGYGGQLLCIARSPCFSIVLASPSNSRRCAAAAARAHAAAASPFAASRRIFFLPFLSFLVSERWLVARCLLCLTARRGIRPSSRCSCLCLSLRL